VADHTNPIGDLTGVQKEPVAFGEAIRGVLVAAVAAGWVVIPDTTINLIVSAAGLVGSVVTTWWARRKVVPTAKLES
jgi:hypothetical protein